MTIRITFWNRQAETLENVRYTSLYPQVDSHKSEPMMRVEFLNSAKESQTYPLVGIRNISTISAK